jgi:hypothetical protein
MSSRFVVVVVAAVAVVAWRYASMTAADKDASSKPTAEAPPPSKTAVKPPATKTGKPLLLLDDEEEQPVKGPMADNSRCLVCHANYEKEEMAAAHAKADIGCAKCHGPSDAHIADESWASGGNGTPPGTMYPPEKVVPSCIACHELRKTDPDCKCDFPRLPEKKSCTDCHGKHRLKTRKCKWK